MPFFSSAPVTSDLYSLDQRLNPCNLSIRFIKHLCYILFHGLKLYIKPNRKFSRLRFNYFAQILYSVFPAVGVAMALVYIELNIELANEASNLFATSSVQIIWLNCVVFYAAYDSAKHLLLDEFERNGSRIDFLYET